MSSQPTPADYGWNAWFDSHRSRLSPHHVPGRVLAEHRGAYLLRTERGEHRARLGGRLRHDALDRRHLPATGDWVGARMPDGDGEAVIDLVLPRLTCLSRRAAGTRAEAQVVAANVDLVVVVTALDHDFNPRRLERWAEVVAASGAMPVLLLNKADACPDPSSMRSAAERALPDAPALVASALDPSSLAGLRERIRPGLTAVLVGSSGVGKSTTVNALLGQQAQATREVREHDHRGRHATTHRELFLLPGGGLLLDTPGLREVGAFGDEGETTSFGDVDALAESCRFRDCAHHGEPGCAVEQAVREGRLDAHRLASWDKLRREAAFEARRANDAAQRAQRLKWKAITKAMRHHPKLTR